MTVFAGVRVLEVGDGLAASIAGMLLADYGARVTKIEPPGGAPSRREVSFHVYNRGKASQLLDLDSGGGRAELARLSRDADVVLVQGTPRAIDRLGAAESAIGRADLVHAAITPFGERGPIAQVTGDDAAAQAYCGIMAYQQAPDRSPMQTVLPFPSTAAGVLTVTAIAAALRQRVLTGLGQHVHVSLVSAALALQADSLTRAQGISYGDTWADDQAGRYPLFRLYKAEDDWFAITCGHEQFWYRLALLLEHPEWISDPRLENAPWGIGPEGRAFITGELARIFATRRRAEWLETLGAEDIPVAAVGSRGDFIEHPQVVANGLRVEIDDPVLGRTLQGAPPIRFHRTPATLPGPAPAPGQHRTFPGAASPKGRGAPIPPTALEGVRVLDLATFIAGPYAPTLLADLGADVIKVETLDGDPFRTLGIAFLGYNRGKRSVSLNLKDPAARDAFYALVRTSDVVVENYRPGVAERLGVDYATLSAINPGLIYLSNSGWGSEGPWAKKAGFDTLIQAISGAMKAQAGPGNDPIYFTIAFGDWGGAQLGALGLAAALYEREVSGGGQHLEASLVASAIMQQAGDLLFYDGKPEVNRGARDVKGESPTYRLYETADGWAWFDARRNPAAFCALAGAATPAPGAGAFDDPAPALAAKLRAETRAEHAARLAPSGIVVVPVNRFPDLLDSEQAAANGWVDERDNAVWGPVRQGAPPFELSRTPAIARRHAPLLGEHTREVLVAAGLTSDAIESLIARGVAKEMDAEATRAQIVSF